MNRRSLLAVLCTASVLPVAKLIEVMQPARAPFVVKDGVLYLDKIDISNAYISTLIVRDSNIVSV